MNVLFITKANINSIYEQGIYEDLLREFKKAGDNVYIVSPMERRYKRKTEVIRQENCAILRVRTGNLQKVNIIEKGFSTLMVERRFKRAIKKYFNNVKFDLVLYSTPPVVFAGVVRFVKKRDGAKSYLLLKDIFPQNAIDIGVLSKRGLKGIIYRYFRKKERQLYKVSDRIGCMSQANCDYLLKHNKEISKERVEICPNAIDYCGLDINESQRIALREKYNLPLEKTIFIYGGNLGKPQDIPFIVECLKTQMGNERSFFLIIGDGTDFGILREFVEKYNPSNVKLMKALPKKEYGEIVAACDIGLLFLDHRFTIPNFPSRLLSYMQEALPVLTCTDPNTDVGKVVEEGKFGWWCESNNPTNFARVVERALCETNEEMRDNSKKYLMDNYLSSYAFKTIKRFVEDARVSD